MTTPFTKDSYFEYKLLKIKYKVLYQFTKDVMKFYLKFFNLYTKKNEILASDWTKHQYIVNKICDFDLYKER